MKVTKTLLTIMGGSLILAVVVSEGCKKGKNSDIPESDTSYQEIYKNKPAVQNGSLILYLTDKPVDGLEAVYVTISRVDIVFEPIEGGEAQVITIKEEPQTFELLSLQNGVKAVLAIASLPEGIVSQIRLIITKASIIKDGEEFPVKVPSGVQTGIKLNGKFLVTSSRNTDVVIDFDAKHSIIYTKGEGYILKPVIKIVDAVSGLLTCKLEADRLQCTVPFVYEEKEKKFPIVAGESWIEISADASIETIKSILEEKNIQLNIQEQGPFGFYPIYFDPFEFPTDIVQELSTIESISFVAFNFELEPGITSTFRDEFSAFFEITVSEDVINALNSKLAVEIVHPWPEVGSQKGFFARTNTFSNLDTLHVIHQYLSAPGVVSATPNFIAPIILLSNPLVPYELPNDTYFPEQWLLLNTGQSGGKIGADIHPYWAWLLTFGAPPFYHTLKVPRVAVVDTGVDLNHPEFQGRILPGCDVTDDGETCPEFTGPSRDDLDLVCGCPAPDGAHGTAVAGVIGAEGNNGAGVVGVHWDTKIIPIKIFPAALFLPQLTCERIANGFFWAVDPDGDGDTRDGADILQNSWGFGLGWAVCPELTNAIEFAGQNGRRGRGSIIVFAAGNSGEKPHPEEYIGWPQNSLPDEILVVGATNHYDQRWDYSSIGPSLDVMAPSGDINTETCDPPFFWATDVSGSGGYTSGDTCGSPDGNYFQGFGGTSGASPHASGLAALLLSVNPKLTREQVYEAIFNTADAIPGTLEEVGHGRIDATEALFYAINIDEPFPLMGFPQVNMSACLPGSSVIDYEQVINFGNGTFVYEATIEGSPNWVEFATGGHSILGVVAPSTLFDEETFFQEIPLRFTKPTLEKFNQTATVRVKTNILQEPGENLLDGWELTFQTSLSAPNAEFQYNLICLGCAFLALLAGVPVYELCPFCYDCVDPVLPTVCSTCMELLKNGGIDNATSPECNLCWEYLKPEGGLLEACETCVDSILKDGSGAKNNPSCNVCLEEYKVRSEK